MGTICDVVLTNVTRSQSEISTQRLFSYISGQIPLGCATGIAPDRWLDSLSALIDCFWGSTRVWMCCVYIRTEYYYCILYKVSYTQYCGAIGNNSLWIGHMATGWVIVRAVRFDQSIHQSLGVYDERCVVLTVGDRSITVLPIFLVIINISFMANISIYLVIQLEM